MAKTPIENSNKVTRRQAQSETARSSPKTVRAAKPPFVNTFVGRTLVGLVTSALGACIGALLPFWPTELEIAVGAPSLSSPFDVPFTIANRSSLFMITDLKISCEIVEAVTDKDAGLSNVALDVGTTNFILPREAPIYVCPLNRIVKMPAGAPISRAAMRFRYSYNQSVLWSKTAMSRESKIFRLLTNISPPRWTDERSLN